MARKLSPGPRFSRYQRSTPLFAASGLPQNHHTDSQRPRWPQIVARRGPIVALVEPLPQGYHVHWEMRGAVENRLLDQRGPFSSRALAVCWARVVLLLREEAWLAVHGSSRSA
jgi:hypothetical protein